MPLELSDAEMTLLTELAVPINQNLRQDSCARSRSSSRPAQQPRSAKVRSIASRGGSNGNFGSRRTSAKEGDRRVIWCDAWRQVLAADSHSF